MATTLLVGLGILTLIFLIEAFLSFGKIRTVNDYFLFGGNLKLKVFVGTLLATNVSLGNFVFLCAIWGYLFGFSGLLWLIVGFILFFVGFAVFAPHFRDYIEDRANSGTVHEYLSKSFSRYKGDSSATKLRLVASVTTIIWLLFALVLEVHLGATLAATLLNIDVLFLFIALLGIIAFYTSLSGYRSVVFTDVLQAIFLLIGMVCISWLFVTVGSPATSYTENYGLNVQGILLGVGWHNILAIVVLGFGWLLVTMDTWQRACASRSISTSRKGAIIGAVLLILICAFYAGLGMYDRLAILPSLTPEQAATHSQGLNPILDFFSFTAQPNLLSSVLLGVSAAGLIMAALSTADTFLNVCAHSMVSDIMIGIKKRASFGDLTEHEQAALTDIGRAVTVGMALLVMVVWLIARYLGLLESPLELFFVAYSVQYALFIPVLYSRIKHKYHPMAALISIVAGTVAALVVGITAVAALRKGVMEISILGSDQWLALTPVATVVVGFVVFWLGNALFRRNLNDATSPTNPISRT